MAFIGIFLLMVLFIIIVIFNIGCFVIGLALILTGRNKEHAKKRMIAGCVFIAIPVFGIAGVSIGGAAIKYDKSNYPSSYVDTGHVIDQKGLQLESFTVDGKRYLTLYSDFSCVYENLPENLTAKYNFVGAKKEDSGNYYEVPNAGGFDVLYVSSGEQRKIFVLQSEYEAFYDFYANDCRNWKYSFRDLKTSHYSEEKSFSATDCEKLTTNVLNIRKVNNDIYNINRNANTLEDYDSHYTKIESFDNTTGVFLKAYSSDNLFLDTKYSFKYLITKDDCFCLTIVNNNDSEYFYKFKDTYGLTDVLTTLNVDL